MKKRKLIVEVSQKFQKANDTIAKSNGGVVMITPPLDENYWMYRVRLKHGQAILAFPKFGMLGCGFAKEDDWNTNLPLMCPAEEIYKHIRHNKKYKDILSSDCIEAIKLIQLEVKDRRLGW